MVEPRDVHLRRWRGLSDLAGMCTLRNARARAFVEPTAEDWDAFRDTACDGAAELWQVAWAGDVVVGQVRTYVNEGEADNCGRRRAWTENISTHRGWRGRGVA
jgi:hypothetical protein